jgi:hypothetical protein
MFIVQATSWKWLKFANYAKAKISAVKMKTDHLFWAATLNQNGFAAKLKLAFLLKCFYKRSICVPIEVEKKKNK